LIDLQGTFTPLYKEIFQKKRFVFLEMGVTLHTQKKAVLFLLK